MEALDFLMVVRRECETKGCLRCGITVQACPFRNLKSFSDDALDGFVVNAEKIAKEAPIDKWWDDPYKEPKHD